MFGSYLPPRVSSHARQLGAVASAAAPYFIDGVLLLIALAVSVDVLMKEGAW